VHLLEQILAREGWQYTSRLVTGAWEAQFVAYGARRPPIKELSLGSDGILDFGAGPLYGAWHVSKEVARCCGPRVAVLSSGNAICLVDAGTSYDSFHLALTGRPVPADRSGLEWDGARDADSPGAARLPTLLPTPEEALEVALAAGPGREQAATQVGRALQAHRWSGPTSPSLTLDARRPDDTREDLAALVERLAGVEEAAEAIAMAGVFLR
jgi:hypothetical protein